MQTTDERDGRRARWFGARGRNAPDPAAEASVFGAVLIEQRHVLERIVGRAALAAAIDALPVDRQAEYRDMGFLSWCRSGTAAMVVSNLASQLGREDSELMAQAVREGFGRVMRTLWRMFAAFSTDEAIVQRAATIYARAVDRGSLTARLEAPGHVVLMLTGWRSVTRLDLVAIATGMEAALDAAGRRMRASYRRDGDGYRFDLVTAERP